jgi:hypothetical protein
MAEPDRAGALIFGLKAKASEGRRDAAHLPFAQSSGESAAREKWYDWSGGDPNVKRKRRARERRAARDLDRRSTVCASDGDGRRRKAVPIKPSKLR